MSRENYVAAVSSGDYLRALEATRDEIALDLDACESMRDKAALYLRLADVLQRIEAARPQQERGDVVDEIAKRRAARGAVAAAGARRAEQSG